MQTSGNEPVYVISVAARLAGLPCWVLRVLDQEGIVIPIRTDSNRRLYSDNDIALLARVQELTKRGVNIPGIKIILEMEGHGSSHSESSAANALDNGHTVAAGAPPLPSVRIAAANPEGTL